jgi:hypothetical protein
MDDAFGAACKELHVTHQSTALRTLIATLILAAAHRKGGVLFAVPRKSGTNDEGPRPVAAVCQILRDLESRQRDPASSN